jgi:hypothetical protein
VVPPLPLRCEEQDPQLGYAEEELVAESTAYTVSPAGSAST